MAGGIYFVLAVAMTLFTVRGDSVATIWPADAVVLALMLHQNRKHLPAMLVAVFLGNVIANLATRGAPAGAVLFGLSNVLGLVITLAGTYASAVRDKSINTPKSLLRFALWGGLVGPIFSALCGAATAKFLFNQPFTISFVSWFLSLSLGQLIITPLAHDFLSGEYLRCFREKTRKQLWEVAGLMGFTAAVTAIVFTRDYPMVFLLYIPVMLVTFRLSWPGTKMAVMIVAIIGSWTILSGAGPLPLLFSNREVQIFGFQFFLTSLLLTTYPIAVILDARKKLMQELSESEKSLRLLAAQSPILLLNFDLDGVCRKALGAAEMLLGRSSESLLGYTLQDISEEGYLELRAAHEKAIDDPFSLQSVEFRAFRVNGKWMEATFRITVDDKGRCLGTLATVHDITGRKQQELSLARSASTDSLTGLLNRAGFLARLQMALVDAPSGAISLALIDVDRFKLINDNCGHVAGDAVLSVIAMRVAGEIRSTDAVGRLGGDEFVILLATPDWNKVQDICNRVVNSVSSEPVPLPSGGSIKTAISCGVARYRHGLTAEEFIHEADLALYEAKRTGRNRMVAA